MNILVTGSAGFIGHFVARRLLEEGRTVVGVDNMNDYYDVRLKMHRNSILCSEFSSYDYHHCDIADFERLRDLFNTYRFEYVVHLAAQAGVRYSLSNPRAYLHSNLAGFLNVLECCRHQGIRHLLFASSSSVYGMNTKIPFSVRHNVDHPVSLYAASKKSNELMAHCYAHLFGIPATGLRFFTVYGPMGRPDMAYYKFTDAIANGRPIDVYNNGEMERDFTYIDDIVEGVYRLLWKAPRGNPSWDGANPDPGSSSAPYRIFNIGNNSPVSLMRFIGLIEEALGRKATLNLLPMQPGDVKTTFADIDDLLGEVGYRPSTPIETGIKRFIDWYMDYHRVG